MCKAKLQKKQKKEEKKRKKRGKFYSEETNLTVNAI